MHDFTCRPGCPYCSPAKEDEFVGVRCGQIEIVQDSENRPAQLLLSSQLVEDEELSEVETGGWLVDQQDRFAWLHAAALELAQCARYMYALALPTRQGGV